MTTERIELCPNVWLNMVQTNRFKTGCFSFNLLRPLQHETASPNALLPSVLLRGCRSHPDMQAISSHLDILFGASTGTLVRKKGEVQSVGLYADFLEDCYAEGEAIFSEMMDFLQDLLFAPCMRDGGFLEEYVSGEALNLANTIDGRINDKRSYAVSRLLKHMCDGEAYSVPRLGHKQSLETITAKSLYRQWQQMLQSSPVELFYLGQQPKEKVLSAMEQFAARLPKRLDAVAAQTQMVIPDRPVQFVEEAMDVTQGKLNLGFRTNITVQDPRYPAMMLLNAVFWLRYDQ